MQLVRYEEESQQFRYVGLGTPEMFAVPVTAARTRIWVWIAQDELVHLFEPRSSADTLQYVAAMAFMDSRYPIDCEYDVAERGYYIRGYLDETRGRIDAGHMLILPRGDTPTPSSEAAHTPDIVQPVARQSRRVLHL